MQNNLIVLKAVRKCLLQADIPMAARGVRDGHGLRVLPIALQAARKCL